MASNNFTVLKYINDENIVAKLILNEEKKWSQSNSPGMILFNPDLENINVGDLVGKKIRINGAIYKIDGIEKNPFVIMTISKIQLLI